MNDFLDRIVDYEAGDLSEEEAIALFQELVDSGLAWSLPRIIGRAESDHGLLALVGAGIGVAILPHWLADDSVATLTLPELRDVHRIGLVWRKSSEATTRPFRDFAAGHDWDAAARHPVIGH